MNNLLNQYKRDIAVRSRIRLDALGATHDDPRVTQGDPRMTQDVARVTEDDPRVTREDPRLIQDDPLSVFVVTTC